MKRPHRRIPLLVAFALILTACGGTAARSPAMATDPGVAAAVDAQPPVDMAAFRSQGKLAFVADDRLTILDGERVTLHTVTGSGQARYPTWSSDGQWLAYLRAASADARMTTLWLVRSDGSQAHAVSGLPAPVAQGYLTPSLAWSPTAETLAVVLAGPPGADGLWLVHTDGSIQQAAAQGQSVGSFAWSPDGQALAYTATLPTQGRPDALFTVPVGGGTATQRLVAAANTGLLVADWWPDGQGLVFWPDPDHSSSVALDGLMLQSLALGSTSTRDLTKTPLYPDWRSWFPTGDQLLVVEQQGWRAAWDRKSLATCDVRAGACRSLPQSPDAVSFAPAWSPDGSRVALVRAKDVGVTGGLGSVSAATWNLTRTLVIADATGANARTLTAAGEGIDRPQWSRDGTRLLYLRDNAVWLIGADGGAPQQIVGPLPNPPDGASTYGHVSWERSVAWYR